jgi:glycosyltransferase involved in cell wall biosynthesis
MNNNDVKKILFLTPVFRGFGGAEMLMIRIAKYYKSKGIKVKILLENSDFLDDFIAKCNDGDLEFEFVKIADGGYTGLMFFWQLFVQSLRVTRLIKKESPDVVQIMLPSTLQGLAIILGCSFCRIPTNVVFALVGENDKYCVSSRRSRFYRWAKRPFQIWSVLSKNNAKIVEEAFGLNEDEVRVIHNGYATKSSNAPKDRRIVRQELGITDDKLVLITTARLAEQKGHKWLVEVMPKIVEKYPNVIFLWVGDGELQEELQTMLKASGIDMYVLMTGFRTDVMDLLHAADLFVFPTEFEGCPASLHEAVFSKCPVFASDASGIPEVIEHKRHGLLFESKNVADLYKKLDMALSDMDQMRRYAENARAEVTERFSEDVMFRSYLALLNELMKLKNG